MAFGFPAALWLLPLALLPLLARRPRPVRRLPVATLDFWAAVAAREAAPLARRLRRHWLVAIQIAIAAAVILAVARPLWPWRAAVAAIVVDTSLSMSATSGGTSRMAQAARRAGDWANTLPAGTRVRVITSAPVPQVAGEFPSSGPVLARALAALRASGAAGTLDAAVAFARAGDPVPGRVLAVTDGAGPGNRDGRDGVEWAAVGTPADNTAIVSLNARRARATAVETDILAHVWNYGARAVSTTLTLSHEGRVLTRRPLTIAPHAGATVTATVSEPAGLVTAAIDTADALSGDNTRATLITPPLALRVALRGRDAFLERALRSRAGLELVTDEAGADVIVCAGCGPGAASRTPPGAGVLIVPAAPEPPMPAAPLTAMAVPAGLRAPQGLDGIEAVVIDGAGAPGIVVVRAGPRPALVVSEIHGRRGAELRLDLSRSPLVLAPAFPILVADVVDWLAGRDLQAGTFDAGTPAVRRLPAGTGDATVTGPDGSAMAAAVEGDRVTVGATAAAGVYHVRRGATDERFVVNPVTAGESDVTAAVPAVPDAPAALGREAAATTDLSPLVLGLALLLIAVEWRLRPGPWRSPRGAAAALVLAAIVVPRVPWGEAPRAVVFALDTSDSMDAYHDDTQGALRDGTAAMRRGDRAGLVVFGAGAAVERPLATAPLAGTAPAARTVRSATNVESGLRAARAALPGGDARVVLLSDGRETAGQAQAEAAAARAAGLAIDVRIPRSGAGLRANTAITRLTAPPTVHGGEAFDLAATVEGEPDATATIVFEGAGIEPVRRPVVIPAVGAVTIALTLRAEQPGLSIYRASLLPDRVLADFAAEPIGTVVAVEGEPRLLYVSDAAPAVAPTGFRVVRTAPEDVPRVAAALAPFDAVVLDDVAPERLETGQRRALAQHVDQGGGLFVLGSPRSLRPLDGSDPLEAALPVDLRPRRGRRAPGLALVVVFDKSGSMDDRIDGAPKIEFARQAVARVLASLPPTDAVGVIAFDAGAVDVAPLQPGHEAAALADRLGRVRPSGATAIAPALERAAAWLRAPSAAAYARRLVLLVSDGRTSPADQARARVALRGSGIEMSTVALGDEADRGFLSELAGAAGGRAFYPRRLSELPSIAAREAVRVSGGQVVEEPFTVQASRHALLTGLDAGAMPTLGGYVVAAAKPGAEAPLRSPLGDPVLAVWRHGLGKVAVYTADLRSPWSAGLRSWQQGPALLAQTTRWVARRVDHRFLHTEVAERAGRLHIVVEARDDAGRFLDALDVRTQVRTPGGAATEMLMTPSAPGSYETVVPLDDPGPYLFSIAAASADGTVDARVQRGIYWTAAQERGGDVDVAALTALARASGGRVLAPGDDPFGGSRVRGQRDIRPALGALALLAFLGSALGVSAIRRRSPVETSPVQRRNAA